MKEAGRTPQDIFAKRFNPNLSGSKKWSNSTRRRVIRWYLVSILIYLEVKNEDIFFSHYSQ